MAEKFLEIVFTKSVLEAQEHYFGKSQSAEALAQRDEPTEEEINFIRARDSFYIATVAAGSSPAISTAATPRAQGDRVYSPRAAKYKMPAIGRRITETSATPSAGE